VTGQPPRMPRTIGGATSRKKGELPSFLRATRLASADPSKAVNLVGNAKEAKSLPHSIIRSGLPASICSVSRIHGSRLKHGTFSCAGGATTRGALRRPAEMRTLPWRPVAGGQKDRGANTLTQHIGRCVRSAECFDANLRRCGGSKRAMKARRWAVRQELFVCCHRSEKRV
jgi:hypothetical protein